MKNSRPKLYIERDMEAEVLKFLHDPEITAVLGPRQCGKTTMLEHIYSGLDNANFITFEDVKILDVFEDDVDTFISQYVEGYDYLFIDEFQYSEFGGKKLKYIYDKTDTKILITGSSSTELSIKGLKFLTGRCLIFYLYPLSFGEFLRFRNPRLFRASGRLSKSITAMIEPYLDEFITYGGYPRVVLEKNPSKKERLLTDIYNIYLLKEIKEILGIKERNKLTRLIKALSLQIGNLITYGDLCEISGFDYPTLKGHLNILQETFISVETMPYFTNKKTELVKNPKIFFLDTGLRNSVIDNFAAERSDKSYLYENFVCSELVKHGIVPKFWRSKSKAEIDFIIEKRNKVVPLEIKSVLSRTKLTQSFLSFLSAYKPQTGYFLSKDFTGKRVYKGIAVEYYPLFYIYRILERY